MTILFAHGLGAGGDVLCVCSTNTGLLVTLIAGAIGFSKKSLSAATISVMFSVLIGIVAFMAVAHAKPPSESDSAYNSEEAWHLFGVWVASALLSISAIVRCVVFPCPVVIEPVEPPQTSPPEETPRTSEEIDSAIARFRAARTELNSPEI